MYYSHERDSVGHSDHVWDKPVGDTGQEPDCSERVRVVVGRPAVYPYPSVRVGVTRRCLQCILNATRKPIGAGEGNSPAARPQALPRPSVYKRPATRGT